MRIRTTHLAASAAALALALALTGCTGSDPYRSSPPPAGEPAATTGPPTAATDAATDAPSDPSDPATGDTHYIWCPDDLVDAWLHLGTGDDVTARDFSPAQVEIGTLPVDEGEVICSVGLAHPNGDFTYTLTVLGDFDDADLIETVAARAADAGLTEVESTQTGAQLTLASADGRTGYVLFGPPDQVVSMSGIGDDTSYLLQGTIATTTG